MNATALKNGVFRTARDLFKLLRGHWARPASSMREVWFPDTGRQVILLRWFLSEWCNHRCPYCPQTHERFAIKGENFTAHAFDNHPIEKWLAAFDRHFDDTVLSVVLTGGETMLDRPNLTRLINHLSEKDTVECIRIDTNAWWKPDQFPGLNKSKLILMCTFHPSQVKEDKFIARIRSYLDHGYMIGMINYVMDEANIPEFTRRREIFAKLGVTLHPNPLWGSNGKYRESDLKLMEVALPKLDFDYRSGRLEPYGMPCYFPALSYEMDYTGMIHVGCHPEQSRSFFDDALPERPSDKSPCPYRSCTCLDKYSFLEGCERNISTNPLLEYSKEIRAKY